MQKKQSRVLVFLLLWIVAMIAVPLVKAKAAGTLEVVEIDYDKETLTVRSSAGDQFLEYSDAKQKNWERAYGKFEERVDARANISGNIYVLDISWVKKTKEYELTLRGDVSTTVLSVKLPVQNRYFKVKYNYLTQTFDTENSNSYPLQWRKADSTIWHDVVGTDGTTNETVSAMNKLYARGAYIYVRTKPQNGTSATATGERPSKEIKVSLKKQASAPSVSMKTAGILTVNTTQEYQIVGDTTWTKCDAKTLDLREIATKAFYQGETAPEDVTIYVRVAATEKKLPSASTVITVKAQEAAPVNDPAVEDNQIEYSFKNATALQVKIKEVRKTGEDGEEVIVKEKPSSKNPYEYTVVKPVEGENTVPADAKPAEDATWTAITAETVTVSAEKAPENSVIFIRKRGRLESKVVYQPESQACQYTVTGYPEGSTVELVDNQATDQAFEETVDNKTYLRLVKEQGGTAVGLQFVVKVIGYDTEVSSITCGGKSLSFTATGSAITDVPTGSAITVTITDTSAYEAVLKEFNKDQAVKITLKNGEVISDKVTLKVLPGASVQKAETFEVIHRISDKQQSFEFVVKAGMINQGKNNTSTPSYTTIEGIYFEDEKLADGTYTINPANGAESYTVTIEERAFDLAFLDSNITLDKAYPLVIKMSNGQEVSGISVKLHENMKASWQTISFTVGQKSGDDDKVIFTGAGVGVSIKSVSWNGSSIPHSANGVADALTVTISEDNWNTLRLDSEDTKTAPVIFEFTDGSKVSRAMLLTLQPATN